MIIIVSLGLTRAGGDPGTIGLLFGLVSAFLWMAGSVAPKLDKKYKDFAVEIGIVCNAAAAIAAAGATCYLIPDGTAREALNTLPFLDWRLLF